MAALAEEHRARGVQADGDGDDRHDRHGRDQCKPAERQVLYAFPEGAVLVAGRAGDMGQRQPRQARQRRIMAAGLEVQE